MPATVTDAVMAADVAASYNLERGHAIFSFGVTIETKWEIIPWLQATGKAAR
jgi:hypothetical protein